jgi:GWxTD domain-containing protein
MYFRNFSKVSFFKRFSQILFISLLFVVPLRLSALDFYVNYAVFKNTDSTSFAEYYLKIPIAGLKLKLQENGTYKASVLVNSYYLKGDSVMHGFSYFLETPQLKDTVNLTYAMLDLKRCVLKQGYYRLNITVTDEFDSTKNSTVSILVDTKFPSNLICYSDIMFADTMKKTVSNNKYTRSKTDIIPNVIDLYTDRQKVLYFYSEFYNAGKFVTSDNIFVKYFISLDSTVVNGLQKVVNMKPQLVNYLEGNFDISSLKQGEYQLEIELYNKKNQKLASKKVSFFKLGIDNQLDKQQQFYELFRTATTDIMKQYLDYMTNISAREELSKLDELKHTADSIQMVDFMFKFWSDRNPDNPTKEWLTYLRKIEDANRMFSTALQKGYLTSRGRVYVEYGPPNDVVESPDPAISYPYQIWHYFQLTHSQNNKKFVFFNQTGALDEYELLHSNATGEISNPNWKSIITKFNTKPNAGASRKTFGDFLDSDFGE